QNRITLETISGTRIRSFSVPYGSSRDLTRDLTAHLHQAGYEAVFLAEGRSNSPATSCFQLNRVSINIIGNSTLFSEIELLPRLRTLKAKFVGKLAPKSNKDLVPSLLLERNNTQ